MSHGGPNEARRAPRRGDPGPRRRGHWVMKPPWLITAEGAGRERGRGGGWELVPGLTCSPEAGWRRRGRGEGASTRGEWRDARVPALPQPREPPEQRRRTDDARSSSCPRPRRRGDVSVHTYTHSGGRGAPSGAQLSPCFCGPWGKAAGGKPAPAMLGEGARIRKENRWREFPRVLFLGFGGNFLTISIR